MGMYQKTMNRIRSTPTIIWAVLLIGFVTRLPLLRGGLSPYQFCDEQLYQWEVIRMLTSNDWLPTEYRAGGFNIYPVYIVSKIFTLIFQGPINSSTILGMGRFFYVIILPLLGIFLVYKISLRIADSKVSSIVAFLYSLSSFLYERYWYPDTYVHVAVLLFLYAIVSQQSAAQKSKKSTYLIGISLGIAVSIKYTTVLLAIPLLIFILIEFKNLSFMSAFRYSARIIFSLIITFLLLNPGLLFRPENFLNGFMFNLNNYPTADPFRPSTYSYYLSILFINGLGITCTVLILIGILNYKKLNFAILYLAYPVALILAIGNKAVVYPRNMTSAVPFLVPFLAIGIKFIIESVSKRIPGQRTILIGAFGLLLFVPVLSYCYLVNNSLKVDTRILAEAWLKETVGSAMMIGTNEFCSGSSPAQVAGLTSKHDPLMEYKLEYYVFNSYWQNPATEYYADRGVLSLIDQSNIHFEQANRTKLLSRLSKIDPSRVFNLRDYKIQKIFQGNGPDIIILKRDGL